MKMSESQKKKNVVFFPHNRQLLKIILHRHTQTEHLRTNKYTFFFFLCKIQTKKWVAQCLNVI